MPKLFTLGYGSHTVDDLVTRLKAAGVTHVVDVRLKPASRNPSYRRHALEAVLHGSGLLYTHLPDLGNLNYKGGPIALQNAAAGLAALESYSEQAWATGGAVCVVCVCTKPDSCHRRLITDTLQSMFDVEIVDL